MDEIPVAPRNALNEFLRHRRNGLSVLVVAGLFLVLWLRSCIVADEILIEGRFSGPHQMLYLCQSSNHAFRLVYRSEAIGQKPQVEDLIVVPYVIVVVPLILISAFLILRRARERCG